MNKFSTVLSALLLAVVSTTGWAAKKVHTIGDSTMANYDESATVTRGWCQYLQQFLTGIEVNNRGKNGASSKSFYLESPYWASVKKQLTPGDYVVIQFAHNDEKTSGMDGDEVKAYYRSVGNTAQAEATDYRGTNPSTTYKEYLRKYVNETRAAGCSPILCAPVCRMYFSGNAIRRSGRHDLGDKFSTVTASGITENKSVPASDHSMDYVASMRAVAAEMDVPFIDLTSATADLYLSYGDTPCHEILGDGQGSTHLSATGATLIARRFAALCREAGVMAEHVNLMSDLSVSPSEAELGNGYKGQTLTKEFMISGFDLTPASGNIQLSCEGNILLSTDGASWAKSISVPYANGVSITKFLAQLTLAEEGDNKATVSIKAGAKSISIPVSGTAVSMAGGSEVTAYWRLEKDDSYVLTGPASVIAQSWQGMYVQRYSNPNANTVWPAETGFDATRKTQRNVIAGDAWPGGEIDEVSTRYIEFGITAMEGTSLKIDEISYYVCGCGGNGMCAHVYYSTDPDFANQQLIFSKENMPANNMLDGKVSTLITLNSGQSLRVRFYPWYSSAATGKTICLSDFKLHGYAFGESGMELLQADTAVVSTEWFTPQGIKLPAPAKGLNIRRDTLANGEIAVNKTIK